MNIVIDAPLPEPQAQQLRLLSPAIRLLTMAELSEAHVVYTTSAKFDPATAPRLRWVQTNTAATNPIAGKPILGTPIPIANVTGAYTVAVAECTLAMLLALTRRITLGCRYQAESRWPVDSTPFQGEELYGMTMGVVGYGSIGRQLGRLASVMGMTVLACKRRPEERRDDSYCLPGTGDPDGAIPQAWFGQSEIGEMFRQSDIAVVTLPDVPTTRGLIGKSTLVALPAHAYFVNVGRGAVVDEPALIELLQAGKLAGAGLDVFVEEPLPVSSPFWKMSNVLVMPHIASFTKLQAARAAGVLIENVRRDLAGEPLVNVIDKQLLY